MIANAIAAVRLEATVRFSYREAGKMATPSEVTLIVRD
jgi:hypothetical protein